MITKASQKYPEIIHQITAVRASLDGAMGLIIEDLVEGVKSSASWKKKTSYSRTERLFIEYSLKSGKNSLFRW